MRPGTQLRTAHLSDAEFSHLLDGAQPGETTEAHLRGCAPCREQLQTVGSSLASFRVLSTAWAEREAPRRVPAPARWMRGLQIQTSLSAGLAATATAALLAFWLGVPGLPGTAWSHLPAVHSAPVPTNAELAEDNNLLQSIDQALREPGSPEISALQVAPRRNEPRPAGTLSD